jgi:cell division septum initiation protein DivIVA
MSVPQDSLGLAVFDDTATAVGHFPVSFRGYNRTIVDDYVQNLETRCIESRYQTDALQEGFTRLQDQLQTAEAELRHRPAGDVDYSALGARAIAIVSMAQEQARQMLDKANADVNRLLEAGRRDADRLRAQARHDADARRAAERSHTAEIDRLRVHVQQESQETAERAKNDAATIVSAAQRHADEIHRAAEQQAAAATRSGYLKGEELKRAAESEAAEIRRQVAQERSSGIAELKRMHQDAAAETNRLLNEGSQQHQQVQDKLTADVQAAEDARNRAQEQADQIRSAAETDARKLVTDAQEEATRIGQRTREEFEWRHEQLRRATQHLLHSRQTVRDELQQLHESTAKDDQEEISNFETFIADLDQPPRPADEKSPE